MISTVLKFKGLILHQSSLKTLNTVDIIYQTKEKGE
jgi:hypothetical protein